MKEYIEKQIKEKKTDDKNTADLIQQRKRKYRVPRKVQDVIPIQRIWNDGIFKTGNKYSKTYKFSDINYQTASKEDKESMFLKYSELLNSFDSEAVSKITIKNKKLSKAEFESFVKLPLKSDKLDCIREEYNNMLLEKVQNADCTVQDRFVTVSVVKQNADEARTYFNRFHSNLNKHLKALGSKCIELVGCHGKTTHSPRFLPPWRRK